MEAHGYRMPDNMMPDISQAKMLCKHLRDKYGIVINSLEKYTHSFPDGRVKSRPIYILLNTSVTSMF